MTDPLMTASTQALRADDEHPAIAFNRWFEVGAAGEPFFPGLYSSEQLRGVCYLAFMAGRESLATLDRSGGEQRCTCGDNFANPEPVTCPKHEADRLGVETPRPQEQMAKALEQYAQWCGGVHDDGCPEDDTCDCSGKWINDGVSDTVRYLRGGGETPREDYREYVQHKADCAIGGDRKYRAGNGHTCTCGLDDLLATTPRIATTPRNRKTGKC